MPRGCKSQIVVLITGAVHSFGGIQTFNRSLIKALEEIAAVRSLHVCVLSLLDEDESHSVSSCSHSGRVEVRCFSGNRRKFVAAAVSAARTADCAVIGHVNLSPIALLMTSKRKYLLVYGIDGWRAMTLPQRLAVRTVNRIVSISSYTAARMGNLNRIGHEKFAVIPLTLDPSYIRSSNRTDVTRETLGLPSGPMILTVSRLSTCDAYKNVDLVIRAFPKILTRFPDAFYVVVGHGNDQERLQYLSEDLGIASSVFFPGRVESNLLPAYYRNCDIFVLPSTNEGFGIVFLEAMYYGKPCIGANSGGVPEVVEHERTGILLESSSTSSVAQALDYLLAKPELRAIMGEQGRQRVDSKFSFACFRDRLERILCTTAPAVQ
jgi:phosphatidyl-myo-inositol dimannoside synthase